MFCTFVVMKHLMTPQQFVESLPTKPYDGRTKETYFGSFIHRDEARVTNMDMWWQRTYIEIASRILSEVYKSSSIVQWSGSTFLADGAQAFGTERLLYETGVDGIPINFIEDPAMYRPSAAEHLLIVEPGWCTLMLSDGEGDLVYVTKSGYTMIRLSFDLDLDKIALVKP